MASPGVGLLMCIVLNMGSAVVLDIRFDLVVMIWVKD